MTNYTKRSSRFNTKKTVGCAAVILMGLTVQNVNAVSIGRLNLLSNLGEPFKAEIELSQLTTEELENLKIKIASPETYKKEGLEYPSTLTSLKTSLISKPGKQFKIGISGSQLTDEPMFDILLELQTNKATVVKKFTALLDPPTLQIPILETDSIKTAELDTTNTNALLAPTLNLKPSLKIDSNRLLALNNKPTSIQINKNSVASVANTSTPVKKINNKSKPLELSDVVKSIEKKTSKTIANTTKKDNNPDKSTSNDTVNGKDKLIVGDTPVMSVKNITQKTPQEIASILVKSGINDQEQIAKIVQIITNDPKKNQQSTNPVLSKEENKTAVNNVNVPSAAVLKPSEAEQTANILSPSSPTINNSITQDNPLPTANTQETITTNPITTPPAAVSNASDNLKNSTQNSETPLPWYSNVFNKITLLSALLAFLALIGFFIWRLFQRKRTELSEFKFNQTDDTNDNHLSNKKDESAYSPFSNFGHEEGQTLSVSTDFPPSQISAADTAVQNAMLVSLSKDNPTSVTTQLNKEQTGTNEPFDLSNSTTLISKVTQKSVNNITKTPIKKPVLTSNTRLIITPSSLVDESARKQYRLLKNLVETKPADLTAKVMFIKFLHKHKLLEETRSELEKFKTTTQQQGPQWAEVDEIYNSYQQATVAEPSISSKINPSPLFAAQKSPLDFSASDDSNNALNLDLGNLTVLMSPPSTNIVTPTDNTVTSVLPSFTQPSKDDKTNDNNEAQSIETIDFDFIHNDSTKTNFFNTKISPPTAIKNPQKQQTIPDVIAIKNNTDSSGIDFTTSLDSSTSLIKNQIDPKK